MRAYVAARRPRPVTIRRARKWPRDRAGLLGFLSYLALSVLFFGRGVIADPAHRLINAGTGHDPSLYIWGLVWWPYALAHRLNPFLCRVIWAPNGINLAWTPSMPVVAILAAPLTASLGPVVTFNLLCILAPALAGWAALILYRSLTERYWPALLGGYLFGFSPYILGHMVGHLNLLLIFPVPLAVWLAMLRLKGGISRSAFMAAEAALVALQFGMSQEICATASLFGAVALGVASLTYPEDWRRLSRELLAPLALAYALAAVLLTPYLYYLFAFGFPQGSIASPKAFSSDLLNFLIPTRTSLIGVVSVLARVSSSFRYQHEATAYVAPPLFALLALSVFKYHGTPRGRILLWTLAIVWIASLGPRLHVEGHILFGLPWGLASQTPILRSALPGRFTMYGFLLIGAVVAIWFSETGWSKRVCAAAVALIVLFTIPNLTASFWTTRLDVPAFFASGAYKRYVAKGETVVILPYAGGGDSMIWQAISRMDFRMAGGHTGPTVIEDFQRWPIVEALYFHTSIPDEGEQLKAFLATHDVGAIIVADHGPPWWKPLLATLGVPPLHLGGVWLYQIPEAELAPYRTAQPLVMEARSDRARFEALLTAAARYVAGGAPLDSLTPRKAEQMGLLPPHWSTGPDVYTRNGLWLGPYRRDEVAVGVVGSYEALTVIIGEYRQYASAVYFPYPYPLNGPPQGDTFMRKLVMVFDREELARAALHAQPPPGPPKGFK